MMHLPISSCRRARFLRALGAFSLLSILLLIPTAGWAQATHGSVLGVVKDAKGALVAGAEVTLTSTEQGTVRTTATSPAGAYSFSEVEAGKYTVGISAAGLRSGKHRMSL